MIPALSAAPLVRSLCAAAIVLAAMLPGVAAAWVASWAAAPLDYTQTMPLTGAATPPAIVFHDQTVRQRVPVTVSGSRVRVRFSNLFGAEPLHVSMASVGRSTGGDAVSPRWLRTLRFAGRDDLSIAPGAEAWSDPVALPVRPGQMLAVSFHLDRPTRVTTGHYPLMVPAWVAPGNAVNSPRLQAPQPSAWNPVVTGVDVAGGLPAHLVVAFGDSITEGATAADAAERRYPDRLAERLRDRPEQRVAVINAGISGNRLLFDRNGPRGLARFERDVLGQSGVTHAIVLIGINDIGYGTAFGERQPALVPPNEVASVAQVTDGLQQLVRMARERGVKILLGTLLPFKGAPYWSEENEAKRQAVNRWIRGLQSVDVVDFDAALRSADDPLRLDPLLDSGDHLHPNDAGYAAMADAVDLQELQE